MIYAPLINTSLGTKLREAREFANLSQRQVAKNLQWHQSTISRAENNVFDMSLYKLIQLTSTYSVSLFNLFVPNRTVPIITGGTVVVIDDEYVSLTIYQRYLEQLLKGVEVKGFRDPIKAADFLSKNRVRLILSDYQMPGLNGEQLFSAINTSGHKNVNTQKILMTNKSQLFVIRSIAKQESAIFFHKGPDKSKLAVAVTDILRLA